jgi:uncharacterized repeat protein (TIGR03847 family)
VKRRIIDLDSPDRFVAGQAGDAEDDETVYLQAEHDDRVVTVALEREQVAQLAHRMLLICGELERRGLLAIEAEPLPAPCAATRDSGSAALLGPPQEEFRVGTLTIGWHNDSSRVVVEAFALVFDAGAGESALAPDTEPDDDDISDDDPLGPDLLRVRLTPRMALRFARQAARIAS